MCIVRFCHLLLGATVIGCSVTPKVMHTQIDSDYRTRETLTRGDLEILSGITYQATGSILLIDEKLDNEQRPFGTLSIASVPIVAAGDVVYAVKPKAGNWNFTRTRLGVSYMSNTRFLKQLGVELKDDRKAFVTALGSLLAAGAGGAMTLMTEHPPRAEYARPIFPIAIRTEEHLINAPANTSDHLVPFKCSGIKVTTANNTKSGVRTQLDTCGHVTYRPLPKDAVRRKVYMDGVKEKWTDTFPVPACRTATVEFEPWPGEKDVNFEGRELSWPGVEKDVTMETVVSDPLYVRVVKLPPKGEIAFHTSCGADIPVGDIATDPIWTAIAELGTQAMAIREKADALEKAEQAKKDEELTKKCAAAVLPEDCLPQ